MTFIGRDRQLKDILRFVMHSPLTLGIVYGRRRIGKSYLLREALRQSDLPHLFFECRQTSEGNNRDILLQLLAQQIGMPVFSLPSLEDVVQYLFDTARDTPLVLVLDEYPYLRQLVPGMDSILQALIDRNQGRSRLKIILCGSYVDIMAGLVDHACPLYGRSGLVLHLQPMDYWEVSAFYPKFSLEDKVRLYSVFGGVPFYARLIDDRLSVRENILELVGSPDSLCALSISQLLEGEMKKIDNANLIFAELASGLKRFGDLQCNTGIKQAGSITHCLNKLIAMGLIAKSSPINDETNKRRTFYGISDPLASYYYRYIDRLRDSLAVMGSDRVFDRKIQNDFETKYVPKMFEEIARQFLIRSNRAGRIHPPFTKIGRYSYDSPREKKNGEFDVVTKDEWGYVSYEVKFREAPLTQAQIKEEIQQVLSSPLPCHRFGFISRSGFSGVSPQENITLYTLKDMYGDLS